MRSRLCLSFLVVAAVLVPGRALAQRPDADLAERVANKIQEYPNFTIFDDVNINVDNRVVTLSGRVTTPNKQKDIGDRVAKVDGIRTLVNEIKVLPPSQFDADLRLRIAQAIYGHPSFWAYGAMAGPSIHIIVEGGRVTLTGRVGSEVDRALAQSLAQVRGVFSLKNDLKLDGR